MLAGFNVSSIGKSFCSFSYTRLDSLYYCGTLGRGCTENLIFGNKLSRWNCRSGIDYKFLRLIYEMLRVMEDDGWNLIAASRWLSDGISRFSIGLKNVWKTYGVLIEYGSFLNWIYWAFFKLSIAEFFKSWIFEKIEYIGQNFYLRSFFFAKFLIFNLIFHIFWIRR